MSIHSVYHSTAVAFLFFHPHPLLQHLPVRSAICSFFASRLRVLLTR